MRGASLSRIWAVCLKEFIQFRRDRVTFGLLLGLPSILLLIYGYAVELDAHRLPTTVIDLARDSFSRELTSRLELSDYFQITQADTTPEAADHEMRAGRQVITVTIPADFGAKLMRGTQPQLLVEADMSDPATAGGALPALEKIVAQLTPPPDGATTPKVGVELIVHRRFNPESIKHYVSVTGLFGLLLELSAMVAAGHALSRERERGTMENLLSAPVTALELMIGKLVPYILLGLLEAALILLITTQLFDVPLLGDLWVLVAASAMFITSSALFGYTISTLVRTQIQSSQIIVFYLTLSIMLSGFMFPFLGMPLPAQWAGEMLPLTHFLRILRAVMLRGAGFSETAEELAILSFYIMGFAAMSVWRFRNSLD